MRCKRIGINLEFVGNYPWVYLDKVNGNKVKERYMGNHGFTAFFINKGESVTSVKKIFKAIRKYR